MDGDPGLEGYFHEHDRDLLPEERLRFARDETAPPFDPAQAPVLDMADWPAERLAKAYRNYAMEYVRSSWPEAVHLWGAETARFVAGGSARLVAMQCYRRIADGLGTPQATTPAAFADFLARLGAAQGDRIDVSTDGDTIVVRQTGWKLMDGVPDAAPAVRDFWAALIEGAAAAHDRHMPIRREGTTWRIG